MAAAVEGEEILNDIWTKNNNLLDEIVKLCERSDFDGPQVILLIGRSGAGKSAIVNTVHKALTGEYYNMAKMGKGRAQWLTLELQRYDNCGVSLESISENERRLKIERVFGKLPTLYDCMGLADVDTAELQEILELLLGGFIPENTQIDALENKLREFGVGSLKKIYTSSNPKWKITKVVFVQGCIDEIPKNLINCLNNALKVTDPKTLTRKYTPELFLLMTKYDKVRDPKGPDFHVQLSETKEPDEQIISLEQFEKAEKEIAPLFNIDGALETNRIRWASITDKVDRNNPYIANIALQFLKRMVEPGVRGNRGNAAKVVMGFWKSLELELFGFQNKLRFGWQMHISLSSIILCLFVVGVAYVFFKCLSAGI